MTHNIWVCTKCKRTWHTKGIGMHCYKHHGKSYTECSDFFVDIGVCYSSQYWHGCTVGASGHSATKDEIDQAEKIKVNRS